MINNEIWIGVARGHLFDFMGLLLKTWFWRISENIGVWRERETVIGQHCPRAITQGMGNNHLAIAPL